MLGRRILVLALFFVSGASGLVYELVWIRQFGTLFGSSVYSAAIVTAIYMCGLGVGAWLTARFADRLFTADPVAPLRWYGRFELAIAALAGLMIFALPLLARLAAAAASYQQGEHGWYWLSANGSIVRYACAALPLLLITLLMGGTLPLLVRVVVGSDLARVAWHVGLLYGVNSAGAALGCLATDTALVPLFGLHATQAVAIGGNLFAAFGAMWLARVAPDRAPTHSEIAHAPAAGDVRVAWLALAVAATGFASMAMQIVWFRQMITLFGAFRPVLSLLLTVILVGTWLGSWVGGRLAGRAPATLYAWTIAGFVASVLAGAASMSHDASTFAAFPDPGTSAWPWIVLYTRLAREMIWVVGPPAFCAGAAFPLANAIAQQRGDQVGARVGLLYLANTLGGVLGSLGAGFALLPHLGVQHTVGTVIVSAVVAWVGLWLARAPRPEIRADWLPRVCTGVAIFAALLAWSRLPDEFLLRRSLPLEPGASGSGVLAVHEGVNETLAIVAEPGPALGLLTNGYSMSGTRWPSQRYMRAFVHVPMLLEPSIERVLVMCFGVGTTVTATLFHPQVKQVDLVDLSADVLEHSRFFASVNGHPLDDPRISVHVNDARHHLLMQSEKTYDLITGEPPPITHAGTVNLYTKEYFELLRSRLRPGGFVTYWLPLWHVGGEGARAVVRAFLDVFPGAVLLSGHGPELMLVGRKGGPIEIDPERVTHYLAGLPALREDLRGIELSSVADLVGMLAATAPTLEQATRETAPLSDDRPVLEYAIREMQREWRIPAELFSVADAERWCARCFDGALHADAEAELRAYLEVMALYYRSDAFLSGLPVSPRDGGAPLSGAAERALAQHLYLQDLFFELPPEQRNALYLVRHGRLQQAIARLADLVRANPGNDRAWRDLAHLQRRIRRSSLN